MTQLEKTNKGNIVNTVWGTLRITLGALLIWKGIYFIRDTFILEHFTSQHGEGRLTTNEAVFMMSFALSVVIGGMFILVGFLTGVVSLLMLPIFSIGTLFIHGGYVDRNGFEIVAIAIVIFLLLLFISRLNDRIINHQYKNNYE